LDQVETLVANLEDIEDRSCRCQVLQRSFFGVFQREFFRNAVQFGSSAKKTGVGWWVKEEQPNRLEFEDGRRGFCPLALL
jgi:hypothetical protein